MPLVLKRLRKDFDIVLIDSPPLLLASESLMLASFVDTVLLVVSAESFDREMMERTALLLKSANANVIGSVLNKVELNGKYKNYYRYREA
jgi:Mrp family chromosome partitioning ATPase